MGNNLVPVTSKTLKQICCAAHWFAVQGSLYVKGFGAAAVQNLAAKKNFANKNKLI